MAKVLGTQCSTLVFLPRASVHQLMQRWFDSSSVEERELALELRDVWRTGNCKTGQPVSERQFLKIDDENFQSKLHSIVLCVGTGV